jgi:hypothetical protein
MKFNRLKTVTPAAELAIGAGKTIFSFSRHFPAFFRALRHYSFLGSLNKNSRLALPISDL